MSHDCYEFLFFVCFLLPVRGKMGKTDLNPQGVRTASQLFSRWIKREH